MRRTIVPILCACSLLALMSLAGCFTPHAVSEGRWLQNRVGENAQFRRIAILGFEPSPLFQQSLTIAYLNRGIDVVEREKVIDLVREQQLINQNFADLSDKEKALALGRLLDVDAIVLGGVTHSNYAALNKEQMKIQLKYGVAFQTTSQLSNPYPGAYVDAEFGMTYRIVNASSGEILCVGNRILSIQERAKRDNINKLSQLELIRFLCTEVVEDTLKAESGVHDFAAEI